MADETFGQNLKRLREEKGLTQQQLADLTNGGLSRVGIARLETDQHDPTWDTVKVVCQALGVSCDHFLHTVPVKVKTPRVPAAKPGRKKPRGGPGEKKD
jgi:transcriptional regulator with XRE-family HTH domain